MAISNSAFIKNLLKVFYAKEGVANLLERNDPLLKKIGKLMVEGKTANFAVLGSKGVCTANFLTAQNKALSSARNYEFAVEPGQLYSVYTMNAKEVQAARSTRGAYMKIAANKMFAATEGMRKTLAACLYGRGYGEIGLLPAAQANTLVASTASDITLPDDVTIKLPLDGTIVLKSSVAATTVLSTLTINSINGNVVNVTPDTSVTGLSAPAVVAIDGAMDPSGNPIFPVGLAAWIPSVGARGAISGDSTGLANWNTYIGTSFMNVTRNVASDRLAGTFTVAAASEKKSVTLINAIRKARRMGSLCDLIVVNDSDYADLIVEVDAKNTYYSKTDSKAKRDAALGYDAFSASFATNFADVIESPYCPKGQFFILDSSAVEFWTYSNTDANLNDGVAANEPGKQDVVELSDVSVGKPYGLNINDLMDVHDGTATWEGQVTEIDLHLFGSFVVSNPSVCGTGFFSDVTPSTDCIGYQL